MSDFPITKRIDNPNSTIGSLIESYVGIGNGEPVHMFYDLNHIRYLSDTVLGLLKIIEDNNPDKRDWCVAKRTQFTNVIGNSSEHLETIQEKYPVPEFNQRGDTNA